MKYVTSCGVLLLLLILLSAPAPADARSLGERIVRHDLKVVLAPEEHRITVTDSITPPEDLLPAVQVRLHKGLSPSTPTHGVIISRDPRETGTELYETFTVRLPAGLNSFVLTYGGTLYHPVEKGNEQARGYSESPGIVSEEGVYLAGSSYWYPHVDADLLTFDLRIELPGGWEAVSQGDLTLHEKEKGAVHAGWTSPEPQDEIFLIAAQFTKYKKTAGRVSAMVFLRTPDRDLADKYLDATERYIAMYERLIGPYPYRKFALVENFWETGFGMPSFTLIGPTVIRLPFIINSSYPHEILHNWWGNGVFVNYDEGNWSEGLTAYLSDHLLKEQQGGGPEYRVATLQKYSDYVLGGRDFPLTEFRSRHSSASEAVGYGKSLMFFHMLRLKLGDGVFTSGIRDFYEKHKFRFASFHDLQRSFEHVSGKDLRAEFAQWITRKGAPELRMDRVETERTGDGYHLRGVIEQVQDGDAYSLRLPVAVTLEGQEKSFQTVVEMDGKKAVFDLLLPAPPLRLDVDPEFDVFRRLSPEDTPPAVTQALGAKRMLVLLPQSADSAMRKAYGEAAQTLIRTGMDSVEIKLDSEVTELPHDRAVTLFGWENRFARYAAMVLSAYHVRVGEEAVSIDKTVIPRAGHSVVLVGRNPSDKKMALMLIAADSAGALPGLMRKLPHYHKYSYLGFEGDAPDNIAKGRWPVLNSPMTAFLRNEGEARPRIEMGGTAPRVPLALLPEVFSPDEMLRTIRFLAGDELMGRGFGSEGLDRAADYIAAKFREAGLTPAGDREGSYFQVWEEKGGDPEVKAVMKNVIGVIPGKRPDLSRQSVVIGAHYDHLGLGWPDVRGENRGKVHHGADDNASGIAVLVELAKVLGRGPAPDRSIVFVAFTGEEAGKKGSHYYAAHERNFPVDKCIGMLNLDTVGRLGKKKLLVLGSDSAREWVHIFRGAGFVSGVEIETVSERLDSSDQASFEEKGVPAVQLFSGPHPDYHRPTDTADKIDPSGLVKTAAVAKEAVEYLASREAALTRPSKTGTSPSQGKTERKVSIGFVPDFAFNGRGLRLSGVLPGSPAEEAGLREGDVIIRANAREVHGLKDLSEVLKSLVPGSRVTVTFLREGREMTAETEARSK